ncbi:hypothetical protein [Tabrizicola aquatica]|uniref:hypothetical protein n=1 Tax=Tabrizicola aquatica TaxID=909926 RepID=UPI000CD22034|nr:hypothetical protein [Tabrizicola aquatica]
MLLVETFKDDPFFPFAGYATDIQHFIGAQRYWLTLLRAIPEFHEEDWHPVLRAVDVTADQLSGLMLRLQNLRQAKLLTLHTNSLDGCAAELLADNPPMTPQAVAEAQDQFDWTPDATQIAGLTPEAARRDAALIYTPFTSQVEGSEIYLPQSGHPEGGVLVPARHLLLQSEISRECEPLAWDALSDFLRSGAPA